MSNNLVEADVQSLFVYRFSSFVAAHPERSDETHSLTQAFLLLPHAKTAIEQNAP